MPIQAASPPMWLLLAPPGPPMLSFSPASTCEMHMRSWVLQGFPDECTEAQGLPCYILQHVECALAVQAGLQMWGRTSPARQLCRVSTTAQSTSGLNPQAAMQQKNNGLLSVGSHPPTLNREQWLFCRPDNWNTSDPAFIANWTTAHEAASASLHKPLVLEEVCQSSLQYWRCVSS